MKFECKCGNTINEQHGKFEIPKEGMLYYLFWCKECKSIIKVNYSNNDDKEYGYTLYNK